MSANSYFFVQWTMGEGEHSYGCEGVIEVIGGDSVNEVSLEKALVNQVVKEEFGDDAEFDDDNPRRIWECCHERYAELDNWKRISPEHFKVLSEYILAFKVKPEKEAFQFR